MRQSNQKSRSRGRGRKPQNPLSRNYESNGPDVKIRGNAGHIAEKYASLARDALSNGDTVMAENYYQHAEHYNRIIAAAQQQQNAAREEQQAAQNNGKGPQPEIEGTPAEVALENGEVNLSENSENADGASQSAEADSSNEAPQKRKTSRNRKPRKAASEENGSASDEASDQKKVEVSSDANGVDPEIISEDAASLPGSLLGTAEG